MVATVPIYSVSTRRGRIDPSELLETVIEQIEGGVGLITIHPTPTRRLIAQARRRLVPWTSRGGGLVIRDLLLSEEEENVYMRILPSLIQIARRHGTVVSIGAAFRSANIFDANDDVQRSEIRLQLELADYISEHGVGVILESPGHARPSEIRAIARRLRPSGYPIMPLGPIPTEIAVGFDHVAGAIGATLMGILGCAHILAAVTRQEHTGDIPTLESTIEAIETARVAAHIIDLETIGADEEDLSIATLRAKSHSCVAGSRRMGCHRCGYACPLLPGNVR